MTPQKPVNPQVWQSAAEDVLCVLITEPFLPHIDTHYARAFDEMGLTLWHFPSGKWRNLAITLRDLREHGALANWNTISEHAPGGVDQSWYTQLATMVDATHMGGHFAENVRVLKRYGERQATVEALQEAAQSIQRGGDMDMEVTLLIKTLTTTGMSEQVDTSAEGAAARLEAMLASPPRKQVTTGMEWLDAETTGMGEGELWYIAGAYKSGKTRVMMNMALDQAKRNIPACILSFENQERVISAQLVCMMAFDRLISQYRYNADDAMWWFSPKQLLLAGNGYRSWRQEKAQAISDGISDFKALKNLLHIHDRSDDKGGLNDIASIARVIRRNKRMFGTRVFYIDHLLLINAAGNTYEQVASNSAGLQALSREFESDPITIVCLAQLNENTIQNGGSYSAGVKGGGNPSADCDTLLTIMQVADGNGGYRHDQSEIKIKFNRWGASGERRYSTYHAQSGRALQSANQEAA